MALRVWSGDNGFDFADKVQGKRPLGWPAYSKGRALDRAKGVELTLLDAKAHI